LILEREDLARARGARIYCHVLGGAASSDGFHMAHPDPEGDGAVRAMQWALQDAGIRTDQVDYINAHGPGTPIGDAIETKAIKKLFGERAYEIPVSSTKSMIAHGMGAAGALEAIACVKTIETQTIHPTANYETRDEECDLDYVPDGPRAARVHYTLSNSFGLGGQNACLVLGALNGSSEL
jgi:3-oxoacyl-(acyl-carrier-protein) synthase